MFDCSGAAVPPPATFSEMGLLALVPNLYPVVLRDEAPPVLRRGQVQTSLFGALLAAGMAVLVYITATTPILQTTVVPRPSLAAYDSIAGKAPTCTCSSGAPFKLGAAVGIAPSSAAAASAFATTSVCPAIVALWAMCAFPSAEEAAPGCPFSFNFFSYDTTTAVPSTGNAAMPLWKFFNGGAALACRSILATERIALANAASSDVPIEVLLSRASFSSLATNTFRTSLQLLATGLGSLSVAFGNPVYESPQSYTSISNDVLSVPLAWVWPAMGASDVAAAAAAGIAVPAFNFTAPSVESKQPFTLRGVLTAGVNAYFAPVKASSATAFLEVDYAALAPGTLSVSYPTYFAACAPVSCSYSTIAPPTWLQTIVTAVGLFGGLSALASGFVVALFAVPCALGAKRRLTAAPARGRKGGEEAAAVEAENPIGDRSIGADAEPPLPAAWAEVHDGDSIWYERREQGRVVESTWTRPPQ